MYVVMFTCFVQGVSIGCCAYYVSCSACRHFCLSSSSVFACLGLLSPPNRGALMAAVVVSCGASDCNSGPEAQAPQPLQHSSPAHFLPLFPPPTFSPTPLPPLLSFPLPLPLPSSSSFRSGMRSSALCVAITQLGFTRVSN